MIKFHPKAGQILMCDFEGFIAPEMIKKRPIIVLKLLNARQSQQSCFYRATFYKKTYEKN